MEKQLPLWLRFELATGYNPSINLEKELLRHHNVSMYALKHKEKNKKRCVLCGHKQLIQVENTDGGSAFMCGHCFHTIIDNDDTNDLTNYYEQKSSYKRINYFNEYIDRFSARKVPTISEQDLELLQRTIKQAGVDDITKVTSEQLDKFLQKIGRSKHYYDKIYILNLLAGKSLPEITPSDREKMEIIFHEVESVWNDVKPVDSNSFINYPYLCKKIFELLEYDEYTKWWKMTTSYDNIIMYDKIWYKICKILKYEFIPTYK